MTGYYDLHGNFIQGRTVGGNSGVSVNTIEMECEAKATYLRENGGGALVAMSEMLQKHQVLKSDQWSYPDNRHPLSPLVALLIEETFN